MMIPTASSVAEGERALVQAAVLLVGAVPFYFRAARRESATYPRPATANRLRAQGVDRGAPLGARVIWTLAAAARHCALHPAVFFVFPIAFTLNRSATRHRSH